MKTKLLPTLIFFFLLVLSVNAQNDDEEMKLLFHPKNDKEKIDNGGYGAMTFGWTQIDKKNAIIMGAQFAWIANHYFGLGLAGRGFFNDFKTNNDTYDPSQYFLAGGYGGLMFEPVVVPMSAVHASFPIIFAVGGVTASPDNGWDAYPYYYDTYYYDTDVFFAFEPGANIEFNITKFFRVALGASYRLTNDLNLTYKYLDPTTGDEVSVTIDKNALNAFNANVTLKFGWF